MGQKKKETTSEIKNIRCGILKADIFSFLFYYLNNSMTISDLRSIISMSLAKTLNDSTHKCVAHN